MVKAEGEPKTTEELTQLARNGSNEAFEGIFNRFQPSIYNYVYRLMGDPDDAFDLTQETFFKAWRALPKIKEELRMRPWLYTIATNVCFDELRHRKLIHWQSWEVFISVFHPSQIAEDNPEEDVVNHEKMEDVQAVLDRLKPQYRLALILREYQGLSYAEIAEVLGTTHASVKSIIFGARNEFRRIYTTNISNLQPNP